MYNMELIIFVLSVNEITELCKFLLSKNQTQPYLSLQIRISWIQFTLSNNKNNTVQIYHTSPSILLIGHI